MPAWWRCSLCQDTVRASPDARTVSRDRDAHLANQHAGQIIEPHTLPVSWWTTSDDPKRGLSASA